MNQLFAVAGSACSVGAVFSFKREAGAVRQQVLCICIPQIAVRLPLDRMALLNAAFVFSRAIDQPAFMELRLKSGFLSCILQDPTFSPPFSCPKLK